MILPLNLIANLLQINFEQENQQVTHFAIDSRLVKRGGLFFAIKGGTVDGHSYLEEVSKKGAAAAIVDNTYNGLSYGLRLLYVPNTKKALQLLAKKILLLNKTKVIGITGSLGKTTSKDFLYTLLDGYLKVSKSPKSYNSQLTLPLSVLNAIGDEDYLILEMGISRPCEMTNLSSIAPPEVVLLTQMAHAHIGNFKDFKEIVYEKGKIITKKTKVIFSLENTPHLETYARCGKFFHYSIENSSSHYFAKVNEDQVSFYEKGSKQLTFHPHYLGKHNHQNLLGAIAVARFLGLSWDLIKEKIPMVKLPEMRLEPIKHKGISFLCDCYNANVDSILAAFQTLETPLNGGKKIAILGGIVETGEHLEKYYTTVAHYAIKYVDELILYGDKMQIIQKIWEKRNKTVHYFDSYSSLVDHVRNHVTKDDKVLLKGSRAYKMERLLKLL